MTLEEYSEKILKPLVENQVRLDVLYGTIQLWHGEHQPLTRKQKFNYWLEDKKQRIRDIWIIVSGGDIHKNCGDY